MTGQAIAQTAEEDSVRGRSRPEFVPLGLELDQLLSTAGLVEPARARDRNTAAASFVVFPRLDIETAYETNLFRDTTNQVDRILVASPRVELRSDWANHRLSFGMGANVGRHDRHRTEDYEDLFVNAGGVADASEMLQLHGRVEVARLHLQRGTLIDSGRTGAAVEFDQSQIAFGAVFAPDRFLFHPEFTVVSEDYLGSDGTDNDDLDRAVATIKARFAYQWLPGTALFIEPSYNDRNYDRKRDVGGFLQDSHGTQTLVGFTWDVSGVTFLELGVGYLRQRFDEPSFGTVEGPAVSGRLVWNPLDSLTIDARLGRAVEEKRGVNLSGVLVTSLRSRIDYELFYDLLLSLSFDYAKEEDRFTRLTDNRFNTTFEARYLVNANWFAALTAGYDRLNAEADDSSFSNARASLRVGAQL
jgi:hypothetical protein